MSGKKKTKQSLSEYIDDLQHYNTTRLLYKEWAITNTIPKLRTKRQVSALSTIHSLLKIRTAKFKTKIEVKHK